MFKRRSYGYGGPVPRQSMQAGALVGGLLGAGKNLIGQLTDDQKGVNLGQVAKAGVQGAVQTIPGVGNMAANAIGNMNLGGSQQQPQSQPGVPGSQVFAGTLGNLAGNLVQNAFQQKYGGMNGVRLMKRGGYNPGVISAQVGFGDTPSADFLLALNEEKESDPLFIQMSGARPAEEMDTMGYTTAVDKTSVGKVIPVPASRGPVVIKKSEPTPPEEIIETERPADMIPMPKLGLPTFQEPELQQGSGQGVPKPELEPRGVMIYPGSLGEDRIGYIARPRPGYSGPGDKVGMEGPDAISEAYYYLMNHNSPAAKALREAFNDPSRVHPDPIQEAIRQSRKPLSPDPVMNAMMNRNPDMTAEEAALRVALGKTDLQDQRNITTDQIYQMALESRGPDLFNFVEQQAPYRTSLLTNYNPGSRFKNVRQ